jgi:hypothetical protein
MTLTKQFWTWWLRVSVVLGGLQLLAAVLVFVFPFNEDGPPGQHILDVANLSLFIVGRLILTTLFGMGLEKPSFIYYSAALVVTWLSYSALLAPLVFCLVRIGRATWLTAGQGAESKRTIPRRAKRRTLAIFVATNLLAVFLWRIASANSQSGTQHWTTFLLALGVVDCSIMVVYFLAGTFRNQ